MGVPKACRNKLLSVAEAVAMVQPGQSVCVAMAASEPIGLLTELGNHAGRLQEVTVWVCLPLRQYDFIYNPDIASCFFVENWFYGPPDRQVHPQGRISYVPNNLSRAGLEKLAAAHHLDIFWGTATPPNPEGYLSLSLGLVYEKEMIETADLVVLELNENLPWTLGDTQVHITEVDYIVENHVPLFELPSVPAAEAERTIGGYIAELIEDGATIQLGIGGIPNAITEFLMTRRDLGVHTEMFNDGIVNLFQAGVISGRKKSIWKGKMVGAFALGTRKLYEFVHNNLAVEFLRGRVTNDPYVIAKNHKMVSVNTAIQVDLMGQVCSQSLGHRHFSGTGGQLDTHRGAQLSPGGRGIIALRSTAKKGAASTIVPRLDYGAGVTVPSQDVDTVVSEYGVAELKGKSVRDRTRSLIGIAHPEFRPWLEEEVEKLGIVPRFRISAPGTIAETEKEPTAVRPTGGAAAAGRGVPGVTADTIRLGTFCDLSGPNALIGLSLYRGYSAYYDHANRWGGIHGRRIELIMEDVGFDPSRARAAAEKLVARDEVFAMVSPLGTPTNLAAMDFLLEQEVPVICPHSGASVWSTPTKPTYFALQPNYRVEGHILADYALKHLGMKRIGIAAIEDLFGTEGREAVKALLQQRDMKPVVAVKLFLQESRFTDHIARLMEADPELVVLLAYPKQAAELLSEAKAAGFSPQWLGSYVLSGPDMFVLAGPETVEGMRVASYPLGTRGHRGEELYRKLLARDYGERIPGPHSRIGFAAAQLVVKGLKEAGWELSREKFISALEGLKNWTGGLLPPISYSSVDHRGLTTLAIHRARRGRWLVEKTGLSV